MRAFIFTILCCFALPFIIFSQELSYTHYDVKDGLAGSTVYCMALDKEGFLWLGTENGVSRFDGTHFKNFTTRDGLPDNEILELFADSKGRVWMAPFRNEVCFYQDGVLHNQQNDSMLARTNPLANINHFAEDSKGNILFDDYSRSRLYYISNTGNVKIANKIGEDSIKKEVSIAANSNGNFSVLENNNLFAFDSKSFTPVREVSFAGIYNRHIFLAKNLLITRDNKNMRISGLNSQREKLIAFPTDFLKFINIKDSLLAICKHSGVDILNVSNFSQTSFLAGIPVTGCIIDQEGSLWFSTLGQGLYRLNSIELKNILFPRVDHVRQTASCLFKDNNYIVAGTNVGSLYELTTAQNKVSVARTRSFYNSATNAEILDFLKLPDGNHIYLTTAEIIKTTNDFNFITMKSISNKSVCNINDSELIIGTSYNAILFDPFQFKIKDTIWNRRATSVFYRNDTFFIGSLDGFYLVKRDKSFQYMGQHIPAFRNRIATIKEGIDGTLWIATYGDGIVAYKNNKIIIHKTAENGLTSNICRTVFVDSNAVWVGTDKGLNKIDLTKKDYPVLQFTTSDGLYSNKINAVYALNSNIYVGTSDAVSFFNEEQMSSNSRCDLRITGIRSAGTNISINARNLLIPHQKNNIQIDFVGISYRSGGSIKYQYRLTGLSDLWQSTEETFINYPALPSGDYQFEIQAINKFGVKSNIISVPFSVQKLIWEETWFKLLLSAVVAAIVWLLLTLRVRFIRKQESEKQKVTKKITELEQLALKAQMNPHFIFNSLNSIQQYVIEKDIAGANKFISGFSRLMRQTMFFSTKHHISMNDELNYLTTYLELEKDRLENAFTYKVEVDATIQPQDYLIPPMILQPYVENSVRHGVRYRKDNKGVILIEVKKEEEYLVFIIEDNGIGRKRSQQLKGNTSIEYQSRGMSLTEDRVNILNEKNVHKIKIAVEDLEDATGNSSGTRVTVKFPSIEN